MTDKALSAAISQLTSNLVENMTSKPWRSYILAKEGDDYIIAGGQSQGLSEGLELKVYAMGKLIKNPQTGAMISLPGKEVASISVITTFGEDEFNEISYVRLVGGNLDTDLSKYYVIQ